MACTIRQELLQTTINGGSEFVESSENEKAVSKPQRRQSDIKIYKEFCDFYARL